MTDQAEVERIAGQPYTRTLQPSDEGGYVAGVLEFPGCVSEGETPAEAAEHIEEALRAVIETMLSAGHAIPTPLAVGHAFSGRMVLRIPPSLHARASHLAAVEGVSLNRWLSNAVAYYAGATSPRGAVGLVAESPATYSTD